MKDKGMRRTLRQIGQLLTGSLMIQLIAFISLPVITRLYSPDAYGQASYLWALATIVGVASCLKYEPAIVLSNDKNSSINFVFISLFISFLTSLFVLFLAFLVDQALYEGLPEQLRDGYIYIIPFAVFLLGSQKIYEYYAANNKKFGQLSLVLVIAAITATAYKWGAGYSMPTALNLLMGNGIQLLVPVSIFLYMVWNERSLIKASTWLNLMKRHIDLPKKQLPSELLNILTASLPVLLIGSYMGSSAAGIYALSWAILVRPVGLVGDAIAKVYLVRSKECLTNGSLHKDIKKILTVILLLFFPPFFILGIYSEAIITLVLGSEWSESSVVVSILCAMLASVLLNKPCVQTLVAMERFGFLLIYNIVGTALRLGMLMAGILLLKDFHASVLLFSLAGVLANLFVVFSAIHISHGKLALKK